jgi:ubiquitin C-terminal hydrolase
MKQLLELPDDILKKENTDSLATIMSSSGLLPRKDSSEEQIKTFYQFWLDLTLKMMNCNSIVIKLFAWDQIQAIIKESRHTRPPANRYLVRNAGTDEVNGIYEGNFKRGEVPSYSKKPSKEGENLFTLFRCTMRSKQKWWFISIADVEKPGTDKDIDYYQHKSTPEQDMEPPVLGWVVVSGSSAHAIEPAPVLIRLETITDENGKPITSLMDLLIDWSSQNNLLERVFGYHSIHREIVSRSTALLTLLCDEDKLSEGDIHAIWKVGITNPSEETYSEVLTLLANSALHMSDGALDILVDLVLKTLDPPLTPNVLPSAALNTLNENTMKVAEFLDKIHSEGVKYIRCLTDHAKDRVIELVWKLYLNPLVESFKNHNHIEDLLSTCLRFHSNKDLLLINFLDECCASLSLLPSSPSATNDSAAATVDEKKMARFVHVLEFLLNLCGQHHDSSIEEFFLSKQFHSVILNEVKRYVSVHAHTSPSSPHIPMICLAVKKRLYLLRIAYGISTAIKLSIEQLNELWSIFYIPSDLPIVVKEEFLYFLKIAGVKDTRGTYDSAYHITECYVIFQSMLCNPLIDWSLLSKDSFECFQTYFNGLIKKNDTEKIHNIRLIGLQTLWNIILHIPSEDSAKDGITLLLNTYQDMIFYDLMSYQKLLDQIFDHLRGILTNNNLTTATENGSSPESNLSSLPQREISRCSDLLNSLLSKSQAISTSSSSSEFPHGVRGVISRIKLTIKYREVIPSTTNYVTVYNKRTPQMEKSPEKITVIDMNPRHTVAMLKDKVRALATQNFNGAVPFGSNLQNAKRGVTLEFQSSFLTGDTRFLSDFGITDGSTVIATILQPQSVSAYDVDDYQDPYYTNHHHSNTIAPSRSSYSSDAHPLSLKTLYEYLTSQENFNCLLNLVQVLETYQKAEVSSEVEEISRKVWEIMMSIPPQSELYNSVKDDFKSALVFVGDEGEDEDDDDDSDFEEVEKPVTLAPSKEKSELWKTLASAVDPIRATYTLQIIDYILQPAAELMTSVAERQLSRYREGFLLSEGFVAVFQYFIATSTSRSYLSQLSQSVALHIIHYCLHDPVTHEVNSLLIQQIHEISSESNLLIEKFLLVAYNSAQLEETNILQRALETITSLLQISTLASQLTENRYSKSLLTSVLKNSSKVVRTMASNFAVEINKSQPVVIEWLIDEFESMQPNDEYCYDILQIINLLLAQMTLSSNQSGVDDVMIRLTNLLSTKLELLQTQTTPTNPLTDYSRQTLLGCLEVFSGLIMINCSIVISSQFGQNFVSQLMDNYLFAIPEDGNDKLPLCDSSETRKAAFVLLKTLVHHWPTSAGVSPLSEILTHLESLNQWAMTNIKHSWSIQTSYDLKKASIPHLGLKNQGCTCYLNSLIQQLYMNTTVRELIMKAKIHQDYRSSLWHFSDEELIGKVFLFEWVGNNIWKQGKVVDYDTVTRYHSVSYDGPNGPEISIFNVHTGRSQKETGRIRIIKENEDEVTEREYAALYVLEQLQRLFCYLQKSKKRYFDPKTFIESCKTLNLNFNIYHQNDATEFYDQLLDRLETALKGKFCLTNSWQELKSQVFGGQMLAQKIPKDCSAYEENKINCGHWQSTRKEGFLKTELLIRNKEKIEDSLSQLVEGELMDGDNKIMCDVCVQKKDTIRRTCFGTLPNLLVVHLKRFDLDFTTFETVKLNNKMSFPTTLDMFPYTKEGIEYYEALEQTMPPPDSPDGDRPPVPVRNSSKGNDDEEGAETSTVVAEGDASKPDSVDYEYELQGVLVHSGIAQGGHYYSFIREPEDVNKWYLFDDDDVTHFNSENIPIQCFGGSYQTSYHGVSSMIEEDRSSNALMLFYRKVKLQNNSEDSNDGTTSEEKKDEIPAPPVALKNESEYLDGYEAFDREIQESNRRHIFINYLVDPHLHSFVHDLLKISLPVSPLVPSAEGEEGIEMDTDSEIVTLTSPTCDLSSQRLEIVKFAVNFMLNILLHCRERSGLKMWIQSLKEMFACQTNAAVWLLRFIIGKKATILREFLFHCGDAMARGTFVQLLVTTLTSLSSQDTEIQSEDCLLPFLSLKASEIIQLVTQHHHDHKSLLVAYLFSVLKMIPDIPSYLRSCDEVFNLIRDMSVALPPIRQYLIEKDVLAQLCHFITPESSCPQIEEIFHHSQRFSSMDMKPLFPVIFEAIAGLLNVPQKQRVPLLIERTSIWDPELTQEARDALSIIFKENSHFGGMDSRDIINYMDRIHEYDDTVPKVTALQVRSILDRYDTTTDGRLSLAGFFRHYADTALYQPKSVWKVCTPLHSQSSLSPLTFVCPQDLKAFGFQNDLTRATGLLSEAVDLTQYPPLKLPSASSTAILSLKFLESGLECAELVTGAILKRMSWKNPELSKILCRMVRVSSPLSPRNPSCRSSLD